MANKIFLIGNLCADPTISQTLNGTSICKFSIAVNRNYTNGDEERKTDFFNITAWNGQAESIAKYCNKGTKVSVIGSVQIRNYEDNKGNKRTSIDVIAQEVEFLSKNERKQEKQNIKNSSQMNVYEDDGDIPF